MIASKSLVSEAGGRVVGNAGGEALLPPPHPVGAGVSVPLLQKMERFFSWHTVKNQNFKKQTKFLKNGLLIFW